MAGFFDETYYLKHKAVQLAKSGITDADGKPYSADTLKAALADLGLTPEEHYKSYGSNEKLNPNPYFNEEEYLAAKKALLAESNPAWATKTVEELRTALEATGMTAAEHYEKYGAFEANSKGELLNPSNAFDANAYFAAKLEELRAAGVKGTDSMTVVQLAEFFKKVGMNPVTHYEAHGADEATQTQIPLVQTVPSDQRVPNDPARTENVPGNYNQPTLGAMSGAATAAPVTKPADMGAKVPESLSPTVTPPAHPLPTPADPGYIKPPANLVDTNEKPVVPPCDATGGNWAQVNPDTGAADLIKPDGTPGGSLPEGSFDTSKPIDPSTPPSTPHPPGGGPGGGDNPAPAPDATLKIVVESSGNGNFELTPSGGGQWKLSSGSFADSSELTASGGAKSGNITLSDYDTNGIAIDATGIRGNATIVTSGVSQKHTVTMGSGANTARLGAGVSTFTGGNGDDDITLTDNAALTAYSIKLIDTSGVNNTLTLGGNGTGVTQTVTLVSGSDFNGTIYGDSTNADKLIIDAGANFIGNIFLGDGNDELIINQSIKGHLRLGEGDNSIEIGAGITVTGSVSGGSGNDTLTLGSGAIVHGPITLGAGNTTLNATGEYSISCNGKLLLGTIGAEGLTLTTGTTIASGGISGSDTDGQKLTLASGARVTGCINLGSGADTLIIASGATINGAVSGGAGNDTITIDADVNGAISLGSGTNILTIGKDATVAVSGAITGGADGNDVTIGTNGATVTGDIDLGDGANTITLNGVLSADITLGSGNDVLNLNAAFTGDATLGGGSDTVVFGASGSIGKILGFSGGVASGGDVLKFESTYTTLLNSAVSGNITEILSSSNAGENIKDQIAVVQFTTSSGGTQAEIANLFGVSGALSLAADEKGIVIAGVSGDDTFYIWRVSAVSGAVASGNVTLLGTASGGGVDDLFVNNFDFSS